MPPKYVPPSLGTASFSCPHCGTLTHQSWFEVYADRCSEDKPPQMPNPNVFERIAKDGNLSSEHKRSLVASFQKILSRKPFCEDIADAVYARIRAQNIYISRCYTCKEVSVWIADQLLYPATVYEIEPNSDLPPDVNADFEEASKIVNLSPRGAAALLRLAIQKLCATLEPNKNLNDAIGVLVKKGLNVQIQQALDIVRVIGNNAVHPGQIDLTDDKATAVRLFDLVNLIAEQMISQPKHVKAMFDSLPEEQRQRIEKRDKPRDTN